MADDEPSPVKAQTSDEILYNLSLKQRGGRTPSLEKRGETETITDKHRLTIGTKVSRNSREEKLIQNYDGDFFNFRTVGTKGRFAYFVAQDKVRAKRLERAD